MSKTHDPKTRVWTYLLGDLKPQHVKDPLAIFQATTTEKEDTRKLVHSINKNLDGTVPENRVNHLFDKLWPDLEKELATIAAQPGATPPTRSSEEIAAESLELLRSIAPLIQDIAAETDTVKRARIVTEKLRNALIHTPGSNVSAAIDAALADDNDLRSWRGSIAKTSLTERIRANQPGASLTAPAPDEPPTAPRKMHAPRHKRNADSNSKR